MATLATHRGTEISIVAPVRLSQVPFRGSVAYDASQGRFLFPAEQGAIQRSPLTLVHGWTGMVGKADSR